MFDWELGDTAVGVFELSGCLGNCMSVCAVEVACTQHMGLGFAHSDKDCDVLQLRYRIPDRSRDSVSWSEQGWSGADFAEESMPYHRFGIKLRG